MKQKHRMIWERRHGPVGSGMKDTDPYKVVDPEKVKKRVRDKYHWV